MTRGVRPKNGQRRTDADMRRLALGSLGRRLKDYRGTVWVSQDVGCRCRAETEGEHEDGRRYYPAPWQKRVARGWENGKRGQSHHNGVGERPSPC